MDELSLVTLFCHIDDFCKEFETKCNQNLIEHDTQSKHWWTTRESRLCASELIILFENFTDIASYDIRIPFYIQKANNDIDFKILTSI